MIFARAHTLWVALVLLQSFSTSREIHSEPILLVVSYDGFRTEYLDRGVTPYLHKFKEDGVYASYINNVFPTKTFTNHHSIATGLYPGTHGVTANSLYDSKLGYLDYGYDLFHYNPEILPIWALNEKNGGTSGCMMWPGSDFEYSNVTCTYNTKYNSSVPLKNRVDEVISWLKSRDNPPNLVMLYMEVPDKKAHAMGPDSPQVTKLLEELDAITKYIDDQLVVQKLDHRTNVIHLSDHGMEGVDSQKFINLTNYLEPNTYRMVGTSPVLQVVPIEGKESDVYDRLRKAADENTNFNVFVPETLLERWHAFNKRRLGPIIAVANSGYAFQDMWDAALYYQRKYNVPFTPTSKYGVHGYDNSLPSMHPFFMAKGHLFKKHHQVQPFNTVDLFSLFCRILNIKNAPATNGTFSNVAALLESVPSTSIGTGGIVAIVAVCGLLLAVIVYGFIYFKKKRNYFFVV